MGIIDSITFSSLPEVRKRANARAKEAFGSELLSQEQAREKLLGIREHTVLVYRERNFRKKDTRIRPAVFL